MIELTTYSIPDLLGSVQPPKSPLELLDPLLLEVYQRTPSLDGAARFARTDYPLFTLRSGGELWELFRYLHTSGLVQASDQEAGIWVRLTLAGWERAERVRSSTPASEQAFVAMWFIPELDPAWENGFMPALTSAGWRAVRVDRIEHNDKIDDRIIAEIRRSGILVADFTGQRGGVYFEAGFAFGLGLQVVFTVRHDDLENVHFDTRQRNHIVWETPEDLREKLYNRLVATVALPARARPAP